MKHWARRYSSWQCIFFSALPFLPLCYPQPADADTLVVVSGFNSLKKDGSEDGTTKCDGMVTIGGFLSARLPTRHAFLHELSGLLTLASYETVEDTVSKEVREALVTNEPVILLGYSHGATLVLRVLQELYNEGFALGGVRVITVDRIALFYPVRPDPHRLFPYQRPVRRDASHPDSVPPGIGGALNIRQTGDLVLRGGVVHGAEEVDVTGAVFGEKLLWPGIDSADSPCAHGEPTLLPSGLHGYMQYSMFVGRRISEWLGVVNLMGIWDFRVTGAMRDPNGNTTNVDAHALFILHDNTALDGILATRLDGQYRSSIGGLRQGNTVINVYSWLHFSDLPVEYLTLVGSGPGMVSPAAIVISLPVQGGCFCAPYSSSFEGLLTGTLLDF